MARAGLIRAAAVLLATGVLGGLWLWRRPHRRWAGAALLGGAWSLWSLVLLHVAARAAGWWSYRANGGVLLGMPVDLLLGWAVLWGAAPILAFPARPALVPFVVFLWLDLLLMPMAAPVIVLGPAWVVGEVVGLVGSLVPAFLLARWTLDERRLAARGALQAIAFGALTLWFLPTAVMAGTGGTWTTLGERPVWVLALAGQALAIPGVVAVAALQEFVRRGEGTPFPYDPPRRLVTTGPYAYLANPMQVSMTLLLLGLGALLGQPYIAAAAVVGAAFGSGIAAWHEDIHLSERFGDAWAAYRRRARAWLPRVRPWGGLSPPGGTAARLYIAATCEPCSRLAAWIAARRPVGLELRAAEGFVGPPLRRLAYVPANGTRTEHGIAALARALEHIHLGWAVGGWALRLPVVGAIAQLIADAVGPGPRDLLAPSPSRSRVP